MAINTTRSLYGMYQEQYSSKGGPSNIRIEDGKAKWSLDLGGVEYTGEVDIEQAGGVEAGLAQARRDIESTAVNPPAQPVEEPAVLGAGLAGQHPALPDDDLEDDDLLEEEDDDADKG
jgi:hypothetical protein